jgi:hypothetical protein
MLTSIKQKTALPMAQAVTVNACSYPTPLVELPQPFHRLFGAWVRASSVFVAHSRPVLKRIMLYDYNLILSHFVTGRRFLWPMPLISGSGFLCLIHKAAEFTTIQPEHGSLTDSL